MSEQKQLVKKHITSIIEYILVFFLIIQPVFDLKLFYNSISTLIRVIIIGVLFLFYFFIDKNKKKYYLFIYLFVLVIYIFFHHFNALKFKSLVPGNFNYSLSKEILYFIKMVTPFLLIYVLEKSNLGNKKIFHIIKIITLIVGLIIIVSNIFLFSYSSYNDEIIKANFFSWFNNNNNYTYQQLSSKGLFEYANQISALLLMFLPICLISFMENKTVFNLLTIIINIFSLFLLSTKVAVFGIFIVFAYTTVLYIFNANFIEKQKISKLVLTSFFIIILIYCLVLPINPAFMRINESETIATSASSIIDEAEDNTNMENSVTLTNSENTNMTKADYIKQNYEAKEIKKEFIEERYPYIYDQDFWLKIFDEPRINRVNYRFIEISMVKRVIEINNNKLDALFGITNTRIQNIFNIEQDFVVQYYALGIIGLILIFLPYFILFIYFIFTSFKNNFKNLSCINLLSLITICMMFCISYYSGNLLNSLSFTIYFILVYALMIKEECN